MAPPLGRDARARGGAGGADFAAPTTAGCRPLSALPEFTRADVTPGLLRAGILRDGCVLVRGLIDREAALRFAERIDRAFAERERFHAGDAAADGYYEEFEPHPRSKAVFGARRGSRRAEACSPPTRRAVAFEMLELFRAADLGRWSTATSASRA